MNFMPYSTMSIIGPTGSGKSCMVFNIIRNIKDLFPAENPVTKIIYCYGIWQDGFSKLEDEMSELITFQHGLATENEMEELSKDNSHSLLIVDDLIDEGQNSVFLSNMYTRGAHHYKITCISLFQSAFTKNKYSRMISLNSQYIIFMASRRLLQQVKTLGSQIGVRNQLEEAYADVCKTRFNYLIISMHPAENDALMLRSDIFPGQRPVKVYLAK